MQPDRVRGLAPPDGRDDRRPRPARRERRRRPRSWRRSRRSAMVERVLAKGETKSSIITRAGLQVDLRVVPLEAWGAAMIYFTGSKPHNIRIREMAVRKGLKLNEYGLFRRQVRRADRREHRGGGLREARPAVDPADAARGPRRGRGGARRARCPTCSPQTQHPRATCTRTPTSRTGSPPLEQMLETASALAVRVLRGHRPRAEPVHAADDRREDARAARRSCGRSRPRYPKMTLLHGTELNIDPDGRRRLGPGVPRGVRRLRRVSPLALQPAEGRDDPPDRPGDGEPARARDRAPDDAARSTSASRSSSTSTRSSRPRRGPAPRSR